MGAARELRERKENQPDGQGNDGQENKAGPTEPNAKCKNPAADTSALACLAEAGRRRKREIDQQVYALYGLTPDEIKIVEDAAK